MNAWPVFAFFALAFPLGAALSKRRTSVLLDAPLASTRTRTPGVFLLADALVVRRAATCDVFPRQSILTIAEVERGRDGADRYPVTQITYQGLRGRCMYTLDVGRPIDAGSTVLADERIRVARLQRLQAWLKDEPMMVAPRRRPSIDEKIAVLRRRRRLLRAGGARPESRARARGLRRADGTPRVT